MKKITGVKLSWDSYVSMKKHKCPECGSILETVDVSKVVDPKSPDKDSVDFKMDYNTYFVGPTKFIFKEFECPNCGAKVTTYIKPIMIKDYDLKFKLFSHQEYEHLRFCSDSCKYDYVEKEQMKHFHECNLFKGIQ